MQTYSTVVGLLMGCALVFLMFLPQIPFWSKAKTETPTGSKRHAEPDEHLPETLQWDALQQELESTSSRIKQLEIISHRDLDSIQQNSVIPHDSNVKEE